MDFKDKIKYSVSATSAIIIMAAILVLINVFSSRSFLRYDATADQKYTITDSTINTLQSLDDRVTIKVFYSKKFPPNLLSVFQKIQDLINEYEAYSKGKILVKFIDPKDNEALEAEVKTLGIPELPFDIIEKEKRQTMMGYLGIAILYGDKKEIIPVIQGLDTLEYELTSRLKKITAKELKKIGFLTGHSEYSISDNQSESSYSMMAEELRKNYEVSEITVADGKSIEGIETLIVGGPKSELSERDCFEIDQFIMRGGKVIFLVNQVDIGQGMRPSEITNQYLNNLLTSFGITMKNNLIMDAYNAMASFSMGEFFSFTTPYPFWPKLIRANFDLETPMLAKVDSLVFPWASSLQIDKTSKNQIKVLASSSDKAAEIMTPYNIDPQKLPQVNQQDIKKFPMMALITGKFTSSFAEKPVPKVIEKTEGNTTEASAVTVKEGDVQKEVIKASQKESNILVIGNSSFIANNFAQMFPQNGNFFLNAIDYLTLDPSLISIRAKQVFDRPLMETTEAQKMLIKALGIILIPFLVVMYGIIRTMRRKRRAAGYLSDF